MTLFSRILDEIEKYDVVVNANVDAEAVEEAAHETIAAIRALLEAEPEEVVNLNNPIAQLNERAQALGVEPPEYEFEGIGPSHVPSFTCTCAWEGIVGHGKGPNKQRAKRLAARDVLEQFFKKGPK